MDLEKFLTHFEKLKKEGNGWEARCPAHDDQVASLSIAEKDGKILLHCHAGCNYKDILKTIDIKPSELFSEEKSKKSGKIVATYDYIDENGEILYQVCRFDPKDFRARRYAGNGSFEWGLNGTRRVPYKLPDILSANPEQPIFVVEGERDVQSLSKIGLVATCNSGGAKHWEEYHSKYLAGRTVYVIPDNDKTGFDHAYKVMDTLNGYAKEAKIVQLHGLPEKGDVTDWIAQNGGFNSRIVADKLLTLCQESHEPIFDCVGVGDDPPTEAEFLVTGLLPEGVCCVIGGVPKANKSFFADDLIVAGAMGQAFLDVFKPTRPFRTLIYSPEGGLKSIRRRLWKLCRGRGGDPREDLKDVHIISNRVSISDQSSYELLKATVKHYQPDLLLIDPLISVHTADENAADQLQPILDRIRDLQGLREGLTTIVVHHCGKNDKRSDGYSLRGSSALEGWRDTLISIKAAHDNEEDPEAIKRVRVSHRDEPSPAPIGFKLVLKTLPESNCELAYELRVFDLPDGKPGRKLDLEFLDLIRKFITSDQSSNPTIYSVKKGLGVKYEKASLYINKLKELGEIDIVAGGKIIMTSPRIGQSESRTSPYSPYPL